MAPSTESQDTAPLLENTGKEPKGFVAIDDSTSIAQKLSDLPFRRLTYYWIALIAQSCHFVLGVVGLCTIISLRNREANGSDDYSEDFFIFFTTITWSALSLIVLVFSLFFHYKGSENLRSLAGYQHSCMKFNSLINGINCAFVAYPFITGDRELLFEDEIRPIINPLMIGFLVVASGSYFVATCIIYRSAVSARGSDMVPYEIQVPAWKLATTEESKIYRRSGGAVKLPTETC